MLNIYLSQEEITALNKMDLGDGDTHYCDAIIEIEDVPVTGKAVIEGRTINWKVYLRDEMKTDSSLHSEASFEIGDTINPEDFESKVVFIEQLALQLCCRYLEQKGYLEEYSNLDEQNQGVKFFLNQGQVEVKIVSGKERPDLACTTLFGEIEMKRPYMDEIMEFNMRDMMSMEEKIQMAEDGDEDMMLDVAVAYLNGDEVDEDPEKAVAWFRKLADLDNATGQFNLGLHYAKGYGIERDFKKAAYWMQKAADNGDEDAPDLIEKYQKADENLVKAQAGDAQAQADLAGLLMEMAGSLEQAGEGEDYTASVEWAEKAAAQNNGQGLWILALAYEHGRGVDEDIEKAVELYRKGAELGHAASQQSLGCYYLRGEIVEKDEEKGFALCRKSAEQGYALAMRTIGSCYQFGTGVTGNMKTACQWYEKYLELEDDPELEQKVELFKMMGESTPDWDQDYEDDAEEDKELDTSGLPAGYAAVMELCNLAEKLGYEEPENPQMMDIEGQVQFVVEKAKAGDIQAKYTAAKYYLANNVEFELAQAWMDEAISAGFEPFIPDEEENEERESIDYSAATGTEQSTICFLTGDQVKCWVQKLDIARTSIPMSEVKQIFELCNIYNHEYHKAAEGDEDTSYAGLDGLAAEIIENRNKIAQCDDVPFRKLRSAPDDEEDEEDEDQDFSGFISHALETCPDRYGCLKQYERPDCYDPEDWLEELFLSESVEEYFWIDMTRVTKEQYERYTSELHHVYHIAELFAPGDLPFDLNDEDTVSLFGTGKFEALVDFSYGC